MIKNPTQIRDRSLARCMRMLEAFRIDVSCYHADERDVMVALTDDKMDLAIDLTNVLLAKFGHVTKPCEPRFDLTRRRLAKTQPKRPRGVVKPRSPRPPKPSEESADAQHET